MAISIFHRALVASALFAVGQVAIAQPAAPTAAEAAVATLTRAQVDALLAAPSGVLILDVRRPQEVSALGGFPVYLSVQLASLEQSLPFIPRDRTIVTVSNHAARAKKAAALLSARGFRVAGAIGVESYAAEGGTLTGKAVTTPTTAAPPSTGTNR